MVRLEKLVIDSGRLGSYKVFLKEEIEISVPLEPGVLTLYAVAEKDNPTHFTILETYEDNRWLQGTFAASHFIKYNGTKDMVKSLELVETVPLGPE